MAACEVVAWLPICAPVLLPADAPRDFGECLINFVEGIPQAIRHLSDAASVASAEVVRPPQRVLADLASRHGGFQLNLPCEFARIRCSLNIDRKVFQSLNPSSDITDELLDSFSGSVLAPLFADALLLAQLAFPGRISSRRGLVYAGHKIAYGVDAVHGISKEVAFGTEWPPIYKLPLETVIGWESRIGLFKYGVALTPIQRSAASFTRMLGTSASKVEERLFWAMQGLESFYCRGVGDLRRQLSEKSRLFLGPWDSDKNIVGHLYDSRSKFVHGDFNLIRWNCDVVSEGHASSYRAMDAAALFAERLLVATLQKAIIEGASSVEFDYTVRTER